MSRPYLELMKPTSNNNVRYFGLIALSILLAAYNLAKPDGVVDAASKPKSDEQVAQLEVEGRATGPQTRPILPPAFDDEGEDASLDLPIDGTDAGLAGDPSAPDIPNSMTMSDSGQLVPAPPPAMNDASSSADDEVSGAE